MTYTKVTAKWSSDVWTVYHDSTLIVSSANYWPLSSTWLRDLKSNHNYQVEYINEEQLDLLKLELL